MKKTDIVKQSPSEIILYQAEEGKYQLALSRDTDTIWLNLNQIADLYQTSVPISACISAIYWQMAS
jgi:hypothetical protein